MSGVHNIVILTGAGVSAESGIDTFRDGGLWEQHRVEDVATPEAFVRSLYDTGYSLEIVRVNATAEGKAQNRRVAVNILVSKAADGI